MLGPALVVDWSCARSFTSLLGVPTTSYRTHTFEHATVAIWYLALLQTHHAGTGQNSLLATPNGAGLPQRCRARCIDCLLRAHGFSGRPVEVIGEYWCLSKVQLALRSGGQVISEDVHQGLNTGTSS